MTQVTISDHMGQAFDFSHVGELLDKQSLHAKLIRNPTEANCCLIRVKLCTGIRVQTKAMLNMPDQVLNASLTLPIITEPNRSITDIETNGLVVTFPTADHRVGGSSPGLGITFSNMILL